MPLRWRHNDHAGVSNHQPHGCLLNRLFRRNSKKTSKLRVTGLCAGNSPGTGEFPAQMASYAENVTIWWRHHVYQWYSLCTLMATELSSWKITRWQAATSISMTTNWHHLLTSMTWWFHPLHCEETLLYVTSCCAGYVCGLSTRLCLNWTSFDAPVLPPWMGPWSWMFTQQCWVATEVGSGNITGLCLQLCQLFVCTYRQISNMVHTECQNLNVYRLVLQLSLPNSLDPGANSRMKM